MQKCKPVLALFLILLIVVGFTGITYAVNLTETYVTEGLFSSQFDPKISGNIIVYSERDPASATDADICYYDISTGAHVNISPGNGDQLLPDISGNRIVYTDYGTGTADICLYDISSGTTTRLNDDPSSQRNPSISGAFVVHEDNRNGDYDIYLFNVETKTETQLTDCPDCFGTHQVNPDISGTKVVWEDYRNGNADIYMMDILTGEETLVAGSLSQEREPSIDDDIIAYVSSDTEDIGNIYYYRISTGETVQVTGMLGDGIYERDPDVSGDYISYEKWYDDVSPDDDCDIWLYRISCGVAIQATSDSSTQYLHSLSGHRVVYTDNRNDEGNEDYLDLYMCEFSDFGPDIDVAPLNYSFGDVAEGTTSETIVTISNTDDEYDLVVNDVVIAGDSSYWYETGEGLDRIVPGGTGEIRIYYSPTTAGPSSATLQILSNDEDESLVEVQLSGNCVINDTPSELIADILDFFNSSVAAGTIIGNGPGNSSTGRLKALRNMIEAAGDLVEQGLIEESVNQLYDAYKRVDGLPKPPDFATGEDAEELATMIMQLIEDLGGYI